MLVSDFHFDLPEELIAQHPPMERGSSRMLVLERAKAGDRGQGTGAREQGLVDARFRDLPGLLRAGDLLVLNDSRVLPARLFATRGGLGTQAGSPRPSGVVEVLLTEEVAAGSGENVWRALVKPAKKVRMGERLEFREAGGNPGSKAAAGLGNVARIPPKRSLDGAPNLVAPDLVVSDLVAEVVGVGEFGERTLRFAPVRDFYEVVARIGHMPLPPYIRREQAGQPDTAEDRERYQTVYSHQPGSAAAPTAGLHFTPEILAALKARGVEIAYVTLHVGLGTFQPVRVDRLEDIRLHAERYTLPEATAEALNRARVEGRRVIAVGTTTTRTLEHIAAETEAAGKAEIEAHSGSTSIFIGPGHRFRVVGGLLTNFHLPESTLLMLVSAFAGSGEDSDTERRRVLGAYEHAVRAGYRFYSYGDCMLVL